MKFVSKLCISVCIIFNLLATNVTFAQTPGYLLKITNEVQTSAVTYEFDVYLQRTGGNVFELAVINFGIGVDITVKNGGTLSAVIISGSSQLSNTNQWPNNVQMASVNHLSSTATCGSCNGTGITYNYMNVAPMSIPTAGTGSIISNNNPGCATPGTRFARFRITNTVNFAPNSKMNLVWSASPGTGRNNTVVNAFVGTTATPITALLSNLNWNSAGTCATNPALNTTPVISNFTPSTVNAGISSQLTINGSGFGAQRGTGNISFKNADDYGATEVSLDASDWTGQYWSETQIIVTIPSKVSLGVLGSGVFTVKNNAGYSGLSPTPLVIDFAVTGIGTGKKRSRLSRYNCKNGYTFYLGTSPTTPSSAQQTVIQAACTAWSDYLDIDVKLSALQHPGSQTNDLVSVIYIDNSISALMGTLRWPASCASEEFITESDIRIRNTSANWHYGIGDDLPAGLNDFYFCILHEIGHALGLEHAIDLLNADLEVMYFQAPYGLIYAADRTSLLTGGANSALGVLNQIVIPSRSLNVSGCSSYFNTLTTRSISSPQITPSTGATCANLPFTLTSSAVNGGVISNLWSNGATTNAITVTTPGTYTLTVTQNTCSSTAPIVTLSSLTASTVSTHPSNQSTCTGGTSSFTSTGPGGSTYKWQRSVGGGAWTDMVNGSFYSNVTTSTLTVLSAQTFNGSSQEYRCMISQTNKCPQPSNVATLTVQTVTLAPLASVYANASAFTLTAGSPSGGVYSGTGVSGGTFTPSTAGVGNHTITYTKSGCSPSLATQVIQVVTCCANTITTNITTGWICIEGSSFALSIPFTALGTYNAGNTFTAQLSNASGTFGAPLSIGTLSGTTSGTISASIPTSVVDGSAYRIRVVSSNPSTTGNNNLSPIEITHTPCDGDAPFGRQVEINPDNVKVYPNPASNHLVVELPPEHSFYELELFDMNGRVFVNKKLNDNLIQEINLFSIVAGAYTLKLKSSQTPVYKKILIIK